ncbi:MULTISPECIES: multicopper oxidase domain-containing protein [Streptomyces]|uniref:multicopper oxidase domain-containing protein n=1 Tax=Streptomyces TaxID=1883 RepID=UPI002E18C879|nr:MULTISPECIES: multicopper oxidase domain-containing protein [unclassified Streptomyces]
MCPLGLLPRGEPAVAHPIHIHLADFQILGRGTYDVSGFDVTAGGTRAPLAPDPATPVPLPPRR